VVTARIKPIENGDKKLDAFIQALATAPKTLETMSRNMAEETVGLVKDGFRSETDPYGVIWAPKKRPDGRKVLSGKTSRLKGGWHVVRSSKGGFTVAPSVNYALPHQAPRYGRRPRRAMVPYKRKLPAKYSKAYRAVAQDVLRNHFAAAGHGKRSAGLAGSRVGLQVGLNINKLVQQAAKKISGG
jgi:hypothetical protein